MGGPSPAAVTSDLCNQDDNGAYRERLSQQTEDGLTLMKCFCSLDRLVTFKPLLCSGDYPFTLDRQNN